MKKAEIDRKLAGIIDPTYVDWIKREARMTWHGDLRRGLAGVRKVGGALRRLKLDPPPPWRPIAPISACGPSRICRRIIEDSARG